LAKGGARNLGSGVTGWLCGTLRAGEEKGREGNRREQKETAVRRTKEGSAYAHK